MSTVPPTYLLDNPEPIPIANPKRWADLVNEEEDSQPLQSAP
jgi:hypothetical protein